MITSFQIKEERMKKQMKNLNEKLKNMANGEEIEVYLNEEEIAILERLVSAYLDIAELRAMNHETMYMKDWIETIDDYLKMTRRDILTHKGKVSHQQALEKAHKEYDKYSKKMNLQLTAVEQHFLESISALEGIEKR